MRPLFAVFTVLAVLASCSSESGTVNDIQVSETENPGPDNQDVSQTTDPDWSLSTRIEVDDTDMAALKGINIFADELMRSVSDNSVDGNFCVSPVSVSMYLSMMANAIEGEAKSQILACLSAADVEHLNSLNEKLMHYLPCEGNGSALDINNRFWVSRILDVPESFRETVEKSYNAKVESVNFLEPSAVDTINSWVAQKTRGLIGALLEGGWRKYVETPMVSANTVYFKGDWKAEFNESETKNAEFYGSKGVKEVRMMQRTLYAAYASNDKLQMLTLEFEGPVNVLELYLPSDDVPVKDIMKIVGNETRAALRAAGKQYEVNLQLPSFKSESDRDLKPVLKEMGMRALDNADFSAMGAGMSPLSVAHRAVFKVDEKGAEAAAVTGGWLSAIFDDEKPKQVSLNFNRPFFYLLRNRDTDVVLMAGIVANPE